jgi:hypothetical protein
MEKSSCLIILPPLIAVYDVPAVAAMILVSSNPILLSTVPAVHTSREGGTLLLPPSLVGRGRRRILIGQSVLPNPIGMAFGRLKLWALDRKSLTLIVVVHGPIVG